MNYSLFLAATALPTILLIAAFGFGVIDPEDRKRKILYACAVFTLFQVCFGCYAIGHSIASSDAERDREELLEGFAKKDLEIRREVFSGIVSEVSVDAGPYRVLTNQGGGVMVAQNNKGWVGIYKIPTSLGYIALQSVKTGTELEFNPFKDEWVVTKSGD